MQGTLHVLPSDEQPLWVAAQGVLKPRHHAAAGPDDLALDAVAIDRSSYGEHGVVAVAVRGDAVRGASEDRLSTRVECSSSRSVGRQY